MVRIRLIKLENYAKKNNIPIIQKQGIKFLTKYIKENNVKTILEIGSAIGYSSIKMALIDKDITITTIERDSKRYNEAVNNIKKFKLEDRINIILSDALEINIKDKYDLIFIDAAKAQNIKFFNKFKNNLKQNGTIITDNINFHNLNENEVKSKNLKALLRKINDYKLFLTENKEYNTTFTDIGDGLAITKKVE